MKNFGQAIKQQAEELEKKAKEVAHRMDNELQIQAKKIDAKLDPKDSKSDVDLLGISSSSNVDQNKKDEGSTSNAAATTTASTTSLANRDLESVSKEELLEILSKMNKKVKALAQLRAALTDRVKAAESDKERLMDIMKKEVLNDMDLEEAAQKAASSSSNTKEGEALDEISLIQLAWRAVDERNQFALQHLQNEYKVIAMQSQAEMEKVRNAADKMDVDPSANDETQTAIVEKALAELKVQHNNELAVIQADHQAAIEKLQADADVRVNEAIKVASSSGLTNDDILALREQYETKISEIKSQHDEKMNELKGNLSSLQEEKLEQAKLEIVNLSRQIDENASQHTEQVKAILVQQNETIEKIKKEAAEDKTASMNKLKEMVKEKITQMKSAFETKLATTEKENEAKLQAALDELRASHKKEMEALKANSSSETDVNNSAEISSESNKIREEMQKSHELVLQDMRSNFEKEKEAVIQDITAKHNEALEKAKTEAAENNEAALNQMKNTMHQKMDEMQALFDEKLKLSSKESSDYAAMIEELKAEHTTQISHLRDEHALEIDKLRSKNTEVLESHKLELAALREELENSHEEKLKEVTENLSLEHENALQAVKDRSLAEEMEIQAETEKRVEDAVQKRMEMVLGSESEKLSTIQKEYDSKAKELEASHGLILDNLNNQLLASSNELKNTLESHHVQLDELKSQHKDALSELQKQMDTEKAEALISLQNQLESEYKAKTEELNKEISNLKELFDSSAVKAQEERDMLKREIVESYEKKLSDLTISHEERLEQASSEFDKKLQLQHDAQTVSLVDLENKILELTSAIEVKSEQVSSLEEQLNNERILTTQLQSKLDNLYASANEEATNRKQQEDTTLEQTAALEEQLQSYSDQINQLQQQIDAANAQIDEKSHSLQEVSDTLHEKMQLIEALEKERDGHQAALDTSLTLVAEESLDKIREFEDQMSEMKDEYSAEIEKLNHDNEILVQERDELRSNLSRVTKDMEDVQNEVDTLRTMGNEEMMTLKLQLEKYSEENANLTNSVNCKEDEILRLRESLVSFESNQSDLHMELEQARKDLSSLTEAQHELENNLDHSQSIIDALKKDVEMKDQMLKSSKEAHSQEANKSSEQLEELTKELNKLREENSKLEVSNNELGESIHTKLSTIESLTIQVEKIVSEKEDVETKLEELKIIVEKSNESRTDYDQKLSTQESTIQSMKEEVDSLKNLIQSLNEEKSMLEETSNFKSNEIFELKESLQDSADRISSMEAEMTSLHEKLATSESKVLEVTRSLGSKDLSMETLAEELKTIESLRSENKSLLDQISSLKDEIDSYRKTTEELTAAKIEAVEEATQNANRKYEEHIAKLEEDKNGLIDTATKEIQESHLSELEDLRASYENQVTMLRNTVKENEDQANAERETLLNKISLLEESAKKISGEIDSEKETAATAIKQEYEQKMMDMKEAHENQKKDILEKLKVKFNEKLKSAIAEQNATKAALQEKMTEHTDKLKVFFEGKVKKVKEELDTANTNFESQKKELQEKLFKLEEECVTLRKDNQSLQDKLKSQMDTEVGLMKQLEEAKNELSTASSNSEAAMSSLLAEQESIIASQNELKTEISLLREQLATKSNVIEEMTGKTTTLQENLNTLLIENESSKKKLDFANKQVAKLNASESELGNAREEINRLKLELSQNNSLLERMKAEQDSIEKKHGQRTAVVGMLEQQLQELNDVIAETKAKLGAAEYDLTQKDDDLKAVKEELEQTQSALEESRKEMDVMRKKIGVSDSQAPASKELIQKAKLTESLQREVQSLHQQMAKKSSAAQKLLQQRESDCHELKARIKALQQELDKGSFSDRRIFELAAQQSSRESIASSEIEVRNQMVERLTHTLEVNDDNLALAELNAKLQAGQVEELCRIHRREDVNLDYLKATIVQYLSKPPGSSERAALLPVIATLLQFDDDDYKIIEAGKNKVSWFGSVMPTFITAPASEEIKPKTPVKQNGDVTPLLASTSAEVKVSRPPEDAPGSSGRRKGTSLQF